MSANKKMAVAGTLQALSIGLFLKTFFVWLFMSMLFGGLVFQESGGLAVFAGAVVAAAFWWLRVSAAAKYAGHCPQCNILVKRGENPCQRCGMNLTWMT